MDSDKQGKCGNRESTELGLSLIDLLWTIHLVQHEFSM